MEFKDKDQLVDDVIQSIRNKLNFEVDFSEGELIRTLIEAIMAELDIQYWQLGQMRDGSFIDTSYGDDLSELVKIIGIERKKPTHSTGYIKMYRETPAILNYRIPAGTIIETLPNKDGDVVQFETVEDAMLEVGQSEILIRAQSVEPGFGTNVVPSAIHVLNDPPLGIEFATNPEAFIGGANEETDASLKERARNALDALGLGTIKAIEKKIASISGIEEASVIDMARGIGTIDVLVLGSIIPLPQIKREEIIKELNEVKAGGIDVRVIEPIDIKIDVSVKLIVEEGHSIADFRDTVEEAIREYFRTLKIGKPLYKNQLERYILNASPFILDLELSSPAANVTASYQEIIRPNNIIIT